MVRMKQTALRTYTWKIKSKVPLRQSEPSGTGSDTQSKERSEGENNSGRSEQNLDASAENKTQMSNEEVRTIETQSDDNQQEQQTMDHHQSAEEPIVQEHSREQVNIIPVEYLESLQTIIHEDKHLKCKITIKSRFEEVCHLIKKTLNELELEEFRSTQFGHLLDVPDHHQHSCQLMWFFLLRQIRIKKNNEIWMLVNETPMRFSMIEFALITGLNFTEEPSNKSYEKQKLNMRIIDKYFGGATVSINDLKQKLEEVKDRTDIGNDKVKMALVLFLCSVLKGQQFTTSIHSSVFGLVDNIGLFDRCNWGVQAYEATINSLRKILTVFLPKKKTVNDAQEKKVVSTTVYGFVHALQIWAYEMVPAVANKFAKRRENFLPRILRWETKKWNAKESPSLTEIEDIFLKKSVIHSLLEPTEEEMTFAYMSYAVVLEDEVDEVIDEITTMLKNRSFIRHDQAESSHVNAREEPSHPPSPMIASDNDVPRPRAHSNSVPIHVSVDDVGQLKEYIDVRIAEVETKIHEKMDLIISMLADMKKTPIEVEEMVQEGSNNRDFFNNCEEGTDQVDHFYPARPTDDNVVLEKGDYLINVPSKGVRLRNRGHLLISPFMDLNKKKKHRRDSGATFDPFQPICEIRKKAFDEFMSGIIDKRFTHRCGIAFRDRKFFEDLLDMGKWLMSEHIDEALFSLRRRQQKFEDLFNRCAAVMDEPFSQIIAIAYNERSSMKEGDILYQCGSELMKYVTGKMPSRGKAWKDANALYIALNIKDEHWVAVKVDLSACKLVVFDCNTSAYDEEHFEGFIKPLCTMIPIMLEQSEKFSELGDKLNDPWPYEKSQNFPQSKSGDCAIYTIKSIEFDMVGLEFGLLTNETIKFYKEKMAVDIFDNDCQY